MNSYLERLRLEIEDAIAGASAETLAQAPAGKWSGAQILEHLLLTYKGTNRGLAKCMEGGAPLASRPTLSDRIATLMVIKLGYLPSGRKSPERVKPRGMPFEEVRQAFSTELEQMAAALDNCEERFGAQIKILDHPFIGPLTADEWRRFHRVHGHHHARQIRARIGKA